MSRWSPPPAALLLTLLIVAGCAPTDVRPIGATAAGHPLPRPDRVVVTHFAASLSDITLSRGTGDGARRRRGGRDGAAGRRGGGGAPHGKVAGQGAGGAFHAAGLDRREVGAAATPRATPRRAAGSGSGLA